MIRFFALLAAALAGCGDSDPGFVGDVPTNPDALPGWLESGRYLEWARESDIHRSAGPHGDHVRTYFNVPMDASLSRDNPVHQRGAAAVKELYTNGLVTGWTMMVKSEASGERDAWYWYEMLNREKLEGIFEGQALNLCANCHEAGTDYVLTDWP